MLAGSLTVYHVSIVSLTLQVPDASIRYASCGSNTPSLSLSSSVSSKHHTFSQQKSLLQNSKRPLLPPGAGVEWHRRPPWSMFLMCDLAAQEGETEKQFLKRRRGAAETLSMDIGGKNVK